MTMQAIDVTKNFGEEQAVHHANIELYPGTIQGLLGSNGAGKTTLLKIMAGIYKQDAGEIIYEGKRVFENPDAKQDIIFMPDHPYFFNYSSLNEMSKFYEAAYPAFNRIRFNQLTKLLKLNPKQRFNRMSKGMKRQGAFILALSAQPRVMLLDEPFDGLDPVVRHTIKNILIQDVTNQEMSIFVSSHNLREMEDFCDSVAIMHNGEVLMNNDLDDLKKAHCKVQIAFDELPDENFYKEIKAVERNIRGRVVTCIIKGNNDRIEQVITKYHPLMYDILPLTLEEIFTYEMGGHGYAIENVIV